MLVSALAVMLLCLGSIVLLPSMPALASIHTYHEQPGQTTLRSRQSLRDQHDLAWQATLFKRYRDGAEPALYLRLVGFPGQVSIDATDNLQVQTGTLVEWSAPYALDQPTQDFPTNVAQYRVDSILAGLKKPIPLTLDVPLQGPMLTARLVVAPFMVREWLQLNSMTPEPHEAK